MLQTLNDVKGEPADSRVGGYSVISDSRTDSKMEANDPLRQLPLIDGTSWDPERACLSGTRISHCREVHKWIEGSIHRTSPELFLIADSMGSGKTALAHSICQYAKQNDWLVTGFFSRLRPDVSTPRHLFSSLIQGLCLVGKGVHDAITNILREDDTLPFGSPSRQFSRIIVPICPLLPKTKPLVVVIDVLDQGYDKDLLKILHHDVSSPPIQPLHHYHNEARGPHHGMVSEGFPCSATLPIARPHAGHLPGHH